ncbi:MAG: PepSY domain-containing protein [Treponema sp.]|nr:PepSY domain-containing protein [Treponema sp.]
MKKVFAGVFAAAFLAAVWVPAGALAFSAADAIERALAATGGGTVESLELVSDPVAGSVYRIVVANNAVRFEVTVSASTGGIAGLVTRGAEAAPRLAAPEGGGIVVGVVTPRRAARPGGPANPPVSAQRAVEIARDHLVSIGVTRARFDYVYMDMERGRWVWSVEFDGARGRDYEFYIDVDTGRIIKFEIN